MISQNHYIINSNRNFLRLFPDLQYIIQVRKVNLGYAEESSPSAPIPHLIFCFIFACTSIDTLFINPLKLLIKPIPIQLYLQPFHYFREQPYATIISNNGIPFFNSSLIIFLQQNIIFIINLYFIKYFETLICII